MPVLRQDSVFREYSFTPQEVIGADTLTPLLIQRLQTRFAELTKQKSAALIPTEATMDRAFICEIAELDGKIMMIQELFANHQHAMEALKDPDRAADFAEALSSQNIASGTAAFLAQRAASQVHNPT